MFPLHSPKIERIELGARGDVRRAKLYYLRDRVGKRARVRERRYTGPEERIEPGLLHEPLEATDADGMTAEEAVAEANPDAQIAAGDGAGDGPGPAAGDSEAPAGDGAAAGQAGAAESATAASGVTAPSSDTGETQRGVPAGDDAA